MRNSVVAVESNVLEAEDIWGPLPHSALIRLRELVKRYDLSVAGGDLQRLDNGWYVTHSGLLGLAYSRCWGPASHAVTAWRCFCWLNPQVGQANQDRSLLAADEV